MTNELIAFFEADKHQFCILDTSSGSVLRTSEMGIDTYFAKFRVISDRVIVIVDTSKTLLVRIDHQDTIKVVEFLDN